MLSLILASMMMGGAVGLTVWMKLGMPLAPAVDTVVPAVDKPTSTNLHDAMLQRSRTERVVRPWLSKSNEFLARLTPEGRVRELRRLATAAGLQNKWTDARLIRWKVATTVVGVVGGLALWRRSPSVASLFVAITFALIGYLVLDFFLQGKAKARQALILADLADITDQISISVSAGLGFEAAIQRTAASTEGPLTDELNRMLHDIRLGATRASAFKAMGERAGVDDLASFIRAIVQAEKTGVAITQVLQVQADELRERRRQRAEERAMRMPVMLIFPLVSCILPPLFIVLLGPAMIKIFSEGGL